ncbi:MAG: ATP synthase F0 subunit B [Pyrinomonadaceae bacterium]
MVFLAFAQSEVQLVPDGTIFFHIALILLMIWFLNRTLFKPINRILAEREKQTGGRSGEAGNILQDADTKLLAYEQSLREARAAGYSVIEQTRMQALSSRQEAIDAVKAEVAEMIQSEKSVLQNQVMSAQTQLQSEARSLAERISSNILQRAA